MGIGFSEILLILMIVVLLFGASRLPKLGTALGETLRNIKGAAAESQESDH